MLKFHIYYFSLTIIENATCTFTMICTIRVGELDCGMHAGSFMIFRGSGPVLLWNPIFLWFFRGGVRTPRGRVVTNVVRTCDPTPLLYIFGNKICLNYEHPVTPPLDPHMCRLAIKNALCWVQSRTAWSRDLVFKYPMKMK